MVNIKRLGFFRDDDLAWFNLPWWGGFTPTVSTFTIRGNWYNPDEYDLVPKQKTVERLVNAKEEEIAELDKRRDQLLKEKEELQNQKR